MSVIDLDGAYNVREVGGLATLDGGRTRHRLLYRGDSLDAISARDADLLFNKLGIGAVIDVRSKPEIAYAKWRDAVDYHHLPLIEEGSIGKQPFPSAIPTELAKAYLSDLQEGRSQLRAIAEVLAGHLSSARPCIVHCAAGRDRTGAIFAVLLAAVGVRDEDIAADYAQSNRSARHVAQRLAANPLYANGQTAAREPVMASVDTIAGLLALLRRSYQTPARFLLGSGLAATVLTRLEKALVERPQ